MWFSEWYRAWLSEHRTHKVFRRQPLRRHTRLTLEQLENRTVLSNFNAATVSDLIADINAANAAGGTNTITLQAKQSFMLDQVDNTTDGGNGLPVIAGNDNLTIVGNGDTIKRHGRTAFRLIDVASGASLTVQNLTLSNGEATSGGAVLNYGTLTVSGCTLSANTAFAASRFGDASGGGTANHGALTVSDSTLSANSAFAAGFGAADGGGIANYGTLTVSGSILCHNSASTKIGDGGDGGGIFNDGTATVQNSTLDQNSAGGLGGGIADRGPTATLTISGSTLSKNSASAGGGIYDNSGGLLTISNSVVCNNKAADLFQECFSPVLITNSTVCVIFIPACS